jgi:hypothetical protein
MEMFLILVNKFCEQVQRGVLNLSFRSGTALLEGHPEMETSIF